LREIKILPIKIDLLQKALITVILSAKQSADWVIISSCVLKQNENPSQAYALGFKI
jgi:hypothetical protein